MILFIITLYPFFLFILTSGYGARALLKKNSKFELDNNFGCFLLILITALSRSLNSFVISVGLLFQFFFLFSFTHTSFFFLVFIFFLNLFGKFIDPTRIPI